jgi:uncharacterized protein involved in exopolysaccharide biosynthesis
MRRYTDTFVRYWLIALIPVIVLPLADYALIRHTPKTVLASAKVWVDTSVAGTAASYNQWLSPAQNEVNTLNQLLQISSFDWTVAHGSPVYTHMLLRGPDPSAVVVADLQKNMQITADGDNLLVVSYTSNNWQLGPQVVQSFLEAALNQTQLLNQQQAKTSIAYYGSQLDSAQHDLAQAAKRLSDYVRANDIQPSEMATRQNSDPTFVSLFQQVQADQQNVSNLQQKIATLRGQSTATSAVGPSGLRIVDAPNVTIVSSKKKETMNLAIALLIGLLLGGGLVVVKTALDPTVRYADEVPALLDLPVLAVVPYSRALARQNKKTPRATDRAIHRGRLADLRRSG